MHVRIIAFVCEHPHDGGSNGRYWTHLSGTFWANLGIDMDIQHMGGRYPSVENVWVFAFLQMAQEQQRAADLAKQVSAEQQKVAQLSSEKAVMEKDVVSLQAPFRFDEAFARHAQCISHVLQLAHLNLSSLTKRCVRDRSKTLCLQDTYSATHIACKMVELEGYFR